MEFKWYLNRQGVRGAKGDKGDKGFSPYIVQKESSKEKYILHIQNETEDQSFDTPNLKEGLVPEDLGGTYVRLNRETGNQYYGDADEADTTTKGVIRVASDTEVQTGADVVAAVTPSQVNENYSTRTETQNVQDAVTALEEKERTDVLNLGKRITTNEEDINNLTSTVKKNASDITTLKTDVNKLKATTQEQTTNITNLQTGKQNKLVAGDNVTLTDQTDGTTKIDVTAGGETGDVTAAGDNTFTGTNTFKGDVSVLGGTLSVEGQVTSDNATIENLQAVKLTSPGKITAVEISATGIHDDNNKKYLNETDLDGQTISMVDGKVHVNMDELGNEVNDLSGRVTANEADITTLKSEMTDVTGDVEALQTTVNSNSSDILTLKNSVASKQTKLTAGDNITLTDLTDGTVKIDAASGIGEIPIASKTTLGGIKVGDNLTITEDGTLSASGGAAPTNMVTTDTTQNITASKSIINRSLYFKATEDDTTYGYIEKSNGGFYGVDMDSKIKITGLDIGYKQGYPSTYGYNRINFNYPDKDTSGGKCYIETKGLLRGKTQMNIVADVDGASSLNLQGAQSRIEIINGGVYISTSGNYYDPEIYGASGSFNMMVLNPISSTKTIYSPILNVNDARDYFKAGDGIIRTLEINADKTLVTGYTWSVGTIDGGDSTTT